MVGRLGCSCLVCVGDEEGREGAVAREGTIRRGRGCGWSSGLKDAGSLVVGVGGAKNPSTGPITLCLLYMPDW